MCGMTSKTLLIIEDDASTRILLTKIAESLDYVVAGAKDGERALAYLAEHTPDIILLDLLLPLMSGQQILNYIYADERLTQTRVVVLTAHGPLARELQLRPHDQVLIKPVHANLIRQSIS